MKITVLINISEIQSIRILIGILNLKIFRIVILIDKNKFMYKRKIERDNIIIEVNNIRRRNFIIKEFIVPQTIVCFKLDNLYK